MVEYYDISDWEEQNYFNTGGTRNKVVVQNPKDMELYYFKTSLKKEAKDYKYEFWSEIIASQIGKLLGFNLLQYDVAYNNGQLGCLSKSMVSCESEQLIEGYKWLVGYKPDYNIDNKEEYTFQLIEKMFDNKFPKHQFLKELISTIIFDSIIGNEDRHQENWGIIISQRKIFNKKEERLEINYQLAPIYDSGSSLGRELLEKKVDRMLKDSLEMDAYIRRGKSEFRWEGSKGKQKHFDLISLISQKGYADFIKKEIERVRVKYNIEEIVKIIRSIDNCLPCDFKEQQIPENRKDLLIKLLSLRIQKLITLNI